MRSRDLLMTALLLGGGAGHAQEPPPVSYSPDDVTIARPSTAASGAITALSVRAAVKAVRADPLMPGTEKTKSLRFKSDDKAEKPAPDQDARWWAEFFETLSMGMRVAIWIVGAGLLIWVLLRLWGWFKDRSGSPTLAALPPTHVGTLDIRPESLPDDIGAAARALWQRGERRAALSLLYRGALSRLVHGHGVPIRAASTERECLDLAAQRLAPASHAFLARLIAGWQMVAYAQRDLAAEDFEALCADFDRRMAAQGAPA